jgi:outer membrane protein assembly factor BamB
LWTASSGGTAGGLGEVTAAPAVANGAVYVGSANGDFYAIDASSGDVLATVPTGGPVTSSAAVSDGVVYVGAANGALWALSG